jgi:hypothetical protein
MSGAVFRINPPGEPHLRPRLDGLTREPDEMPMARVPTSQRSRPSGLGTDGIG